MKKDIEKFRDAIKSSNYIVALTGAGISTAAGIPDFRGKSGIYVTGQYDPYKTFDYDYFVKDPSYFFKFAKEFAGIYDKIKPTVGHKYLAELEEKGKLKALITQNIDGLHQLAGSKNVIEVHGGFTSGHCLSCDKEYGFQWIIKEIQEKGELKCSCGKWVKPDIVFFGEAVMGMNIANYHASQADLFIVIGSSLTVQPAAFLPYLTNGKVVIVNMGDVAFPEERTFLRFDEDINEVFRLVSEEK